MNPRSNWESLRALFEAAWNAHRPSEPLFCAATLTPRSDLPRGRITPGGA